MIEQLSLSISDGGLSAVGNIVNEGKNSFVARYNFTSDISWVTRKLNVDVEKAGKKKMLNLESNGKGQWVSNFQPAPHLHGALDVDLSASPFTNTLPICRLNLKEKQTQEIQVVYVMVPELEISLKKQRYTCIVPHERYLFEQPPDNFSQEILVDEDNLVTVYPKLFRRIKC